MGMRAEFRMQNKGESGRYASIFPNGVGDNLSPYPAASVAALADLGLSDQEIGGYFRIEPERITRLRLESAPELQLVRECAEGTGPESGRV